MITVTITFRSLDAAVRALRSLPEADVVSRTTLAGEAELAPAPAAPAKPAPAPAPAPSAPAPSAPAPAAPAPAPAAPAPAAPAPAPAAPAPAPSPSAPAPSPAAPAVEYAQLKRATVALATRNRDAAFEVVSAFGVRTFQDLPADQWPAALAAVQAKLAELERGHA